MASKDKKSEESQVSICIILYLQIRLLGTQSSDQEGAKSSGDPNKGEVIGGN